MCDQTDAPAECSHKCVGKYIRKSIVGKKPYEKIYDSDADAERCFIKCVTSIPMCNIWHFYTNSDRVRMNMSEKKSEWMCIPLSLCVCVCKC